MKKYRGRLVFGIVLVLSGVLFSCAKVSPGAIVVSDRIGNDLVALQSSHTQIIRQYFNTMRASANSFVDDVYRPSIIRFTINDLNLINQLKQAETGSHSLGLNSLDLMGVYSEEVLAAIAQFRSELLSPIDEQEEVVLTENSQMYAALINANATITAHLMSIEKVHSSQSELFKDLGLPEDLRQRITEKTLGLSHKLDEILVSAKNTRNKLNERDFEKIIEDVKIVF